MFKFLAAFIAIGMTSSFARALPIIKPGLRPFQLPSNFTADYNFEGIVGLSDCSGSLIRFEKSKDNDYAMVLTNGHCYEGGFIDPGTYVANVSSDREFQLYNSQAQVVGTLTASKVLYGTMTLTDITLYQLNETYTQIQSEYGVHPLTLSSAHPSVNEPIDVVSGYWERGYSCQIEAFIPELREGGWHWLDSVRYSRPGCDVIPGTSGSPVIERGQRVVVAINNTGNESGEHCTVDNPCEVDKAGNVSVHKGYSYAEETYIIYSCVNAKNQFDLTTPGCELLHGAPANVAAR